MSIPLQHHFLTTAHDIVGLFTETQKVSTFCAKLEKQSIQNVLAYPAEKYIGDGFEFLVELLIKLSPTDNRLGIVSYEPVQANKDNGVDGYGVNLLGQKCAVQVKYRGNTSRVLTAGGDGLDSFMTEAMFKGITPQISGPIKNHFIFTTAEGLHFYTQNEKFRGSIKCIGYNELRELLDNNVHFWNMALDVVFETLSTLHAIE